MQYSLPLMFGLANAAALAPRQNEVDVDRVCKEIPNGLSSIMCGLVITYTESPSIGDAIKGDFGISGGGLAAHIYDRECNRIDAKDFEAKGGGKGHRVEFDVDGGDVAFEAHCYGTACLSNDMKIPQPTIEFGDWAAEDGALQECYDDVSYVQGLDGLHYRACKFQCKDVKFDQ